MGLLKLLKLGRLLEIDSERGHMFIKGEEVMILPSEITEELFRSLSKIVGVGGATGSLYIAGKELGNTFFDILKKMYDYDVTGSEVKFKKDLEDFISFIGAGKIKIQEIDFENTNFVLWGWDLPEVGLKRRSDTPVCHIVRGVFTRFLEIITEKTCTGKEVKCQAKGDEYCEFKICYSEI